MNKEQIAALWQRIQSAIKDESRQRSGAETSPAARYLDAARYTEEITVLKRLPLAIAPSSQVAAAGDWITREAHGVPVLMVRGEDGQLRAFINVCRHRGALLTPVGGQGCAATRFICPYHNWTYNREGACVARPADADFAHLPRSETGLVTLPCFERFGLVWVIASPQQDFDWAGYFGPLADDLEGLGFAGKVVAPYTRSFANACNWKLVLDANLETYHVSYAHRNSIAAMFYNNLVLNDQVGEHQRVILPKRSCAELDAAPDSVERLGRHVNMIFYFFPATLLLWEGDHINSFALSPRGLADTQVAAWFLVPEALQGGRPESYWQKNYDIFWNAIDEDFALAASMQKGLFSGANTALNFGANEFACANFHRTLERRLAAVR